MPPISAEDLEAKRHTMEAFFDGLARTAELCRALYAQDHDSEARLLACCYLEGLGNWLDLAAGQPAASFVAALCAFSDALHVSLVVPSRLQNSMPWKSIAPPVTTELKAHFEALPQDEAISQSDLQASKALSDAARSVLVREAWRGTIASIAYESIRGMGAHWLGSPDGVSFSKTKYRGQPMPDVDFDVLHRALVRGIAEARTVSFSTNKWFGLY